MEMSAYSIRTKDIAVVGPVVQLYTTQEMSSGQSTFVINQMSFSEGPEIRKKTLQQKEGG